MSTLLVTVDALRADRLGQYGYHRDTMPALDALTDEGTQFDRTFANGPYTRISVPSFHTSRYLAYGAIDTLPTIASVLSDAGVRTAAIGTQTGIGLVQGEFGYDQMKDLGRDGFDDVTSTGERITFGINDIATTVSKWLQRRGMTGTYQTLKRSYDAIFGESRPERFKGYTSAEHVTDRAIEWLDSVEKEFFLWVHYMDAHRPYGIQDSAPAYVDGPVDGTDIVDLMRRAGTSPESISDAEHQEMVNRYDSGLRYCSRHLRRLFEALHDRNLWTSSTVIFTSDHGEEFGEHGHYFHRNYPYDELIHVPMLVKRADEDGRGENDEDTVLNQEAEDRTVTAQRELLDLAPTICGFHDISVSGLSFLGTPLFQGGSRTVIALGQPGMDKPGVAVRTDDWKYIHTDTARQLYDLSTDPGEDQNVIDERPETAGRLRRLIPSYLFGRDTKSPRPPEDDIEREQLAALGYMELREDPNTE